VGDAHHAVQCATYSKARVERGVQPVRDDCFAGERLQTTEDALRRAVYWCEHEYGVRLHSTTRRRPLEHFETEEKAHLLPAPTDAYDVPLWCDPKVGRDQLAQVDRAFYSLPHAYVGKVLRARADRSTVRFYHGAILIKTHPRLPRGQRCVDANDYPQEKTAYALRDVDFLKRRAESHGPHIGRLAATILEGPLPWTRMRRVYALLALVRKYGDQRVEEVCTTALAFEMHDVRRLQRMLQNGISLPPLAAPQQSKVIPLARYLRPASQYSLPLTNPNPTGDKP
jgi:hypothetical protein